MLKSYRKLSSQNIENYDSIFKNMVSENNDPINNHKDDKQGNKQRKLLPKTYAIDMENSEVLAMLENMSATIKYLSEKVSKLSSKMRQMRDDTVLYIDDNEVSPEEMPFLEKFDSYDLPICDQNRLIHLENIFRVDKSFYYKLLTMLNLY